MTQTINSQKIPGQMLDLLENAIASMMMKAKIPGFSIAIVMNNEIIYAKGFGARNLEANLPATPDTLFGFGSCTKSYTALAIMQLVQEGKLKVTDPVNKHINFKLGNKNDPITIHHLLTHSSGMPDLGLAGNLTARLMGMEKNWIPMSSWDDFFTHINGAAQELAATPGQRFAYSNESYTLLSAIVEKISRMNYEKYVKEKIFNPLKMNKSLFSQEEFKNYSNVMTGYFSKMQKGKLIEVVSSPHPFDKLVYGPGGLISNVVDQINFLTVNMNEGVFNGTRILDASLVKEMQKIHNETQMVRNVIPGFEKEGYGYGWIILEDFFNEKLIFHPGGTNASTAFIGFIPSKKIGISCSCNSNAGSMLVASIPLLLFSFFLGKNPMKDLKFIEIEQKLSMLTGIYETYKGVISVMVVKRGPVLYIESTEGSFEFNGGLSIPLFPKSEYIEDFKFFTMSGAGGKMDIDFTVDKKGKVDLFIERNRFHKVRDLSLNI